MTSLNKKFGYGGLLRFSGSSMLMLFCLSAYMVIDGLFVANHGEANAMGALNIVMPITSLVLAISFMFSTGINSIISKYMGEKRQDKANSLLSTIYIIAFIVGTIIAAALYLFTDPVLKLAGAKEEILPLARAYYQIICLFLPFLFLQDFGQVFFITASRPSFAFMFTLIGGIINVFLDYLFVYKYQMGIAGAAWATGIGYLCPGIASLIYFSIPRKENLSFGKPKFNLKVLLRGFYNGSSEFVANVSTALVVVFANSIIYSFAGVSGVSAYGVIAQVQFLVVSLFIGYSIGVLPIMSYKYGAKDINQLYGVIKKSLIIVIIVSAIMVLGVFIFNKELMQLYLSPSDPAYPIAVAGMKIYVWTFLFSGLNFFTSIMFTSIGDAKNSIIVALLRTFVFLVIYMLLLPRLMGINGVFLAAPLAEISTLLVAFYLMATKLPKLKKEVNYGD